MLCLDEVFVNDVADAAILNRLCGRMWDNGFVLVSTSNRSGPQFGLGMLGLAATA